jgi:putative copper resistance protein D
MTRTQLTRPARAGADVVPGLGRWGIAVALTTFGVLVLALVAGGGMEGPVPGILTPGAGTMWGLPVARAVLTISSAVTVGFILIAAIMPARSGDGELSRDALVAMRLASIASLFWVLSAIAVHLLTLSDLSGEPLPEALRGQALFTYTSSIVQGQAYAAVIVLAFAIAPSARLTLTRGGALAVLSLALVTLVPPALAGHAGSGDYHNTAVVALFVHLVGMALWVGGLVALSWYAAGRGLDLPKVAATYSALALGCYVAVGTSGLINGSLRLTSLADIVATSYGLIMLAKVLALSALGWLGWLHRRRTLPDIARGKRGAFRRLAAVEALVMATAMALAVALARTPPPAPLEPPNITPVRALLGYAPPPEPTAGRLLTEFFPDAFYALGCVAAVLLYAGGVYRLRQRGVRWPVGRTVAWMAGVAVLGFTQLSGLMTYGMTMLSLHMVQHMILMLVVPPLLVLGGPVLLALRALNPARRGERGPREWILVVTNSRVMRILTNPLVVLAIFVSGPFIVYFTGIFETAMRDHSGHTLMGLHFLLTGYLFYDVLIGIDPLPRRPHYLARIGLQFAALVFHALFGLALMESARLIAGDLYRELATEITWLPDALADQRLAGQISWGFGEIPGLLVFIVLIYQWSRMDEREARRFDRREAADNDAALVDYNEYLARLNKHSRA